VSQYNRFMHAILWLMPWALLFWYWIMFLR